MGKDGRTHNPSMGRRLLVGQIVGPAKWVYPLRKTPYSRYAGVVGEKRALSRLDRLFVQVKRYVWAPSTVRKHRQTLLRFLRWQEKSGLAPSEMDEGGNEARGLARYLQALGKRLSGEAVYANAQSLLKTLEGSMSVEHAEAIRTKLPLWRRDANRRNPPQQKAADPVSLKTLYKILGEAKVQGVAEEERIALDVLTIAFVTVSRVKEILALKVKDVAPSGNMVRIRPKMKAKTWQRITKRVSNTKGLRAADMLFRYRELAVQEGRRKLFTGRDGKGLKTPTISIRLKNAAQKLGFSIRLSAHSARKGAAVEAASRGIPFPVLQALGAWQNMDSVQSYIGEALRKTTPLMSLLKGKTREKTRSKRVRIMAKRRIGTDIRKRKDSSTTRRNNQSTR